MTRITMEDLRSHRWFGRESMRTFNHRSRMAQLGFAQADYIGKPVIAIPNTWSEINPCHSHFTSELDKIGHVIRKETGGEARSEVVARVVGAMADESCNALSRAQDDPSDARSMDG